jgi:hypothetical protein
MCAKTAVTFCFLAQGKRFIKIKSSVEHLHIYIGIDN